MTWQQATFPLGDGLNTADPPIILAPGEGTLINNFETVLGIVGYRRIDGMTKWDGRLSNSTAVAPSGSGPIRGVAYYNGTTYCWRNDSGGTALVMYKSTVSGWSAITPVPYIEFNVGEFEIVEGITIQNQSAMPTATATVLRVVIESGQWSGNNATGRIYVSNVTGSWMSSALIWTNDGVGAPNQAAQATSNLTTPTIAPGGTVETQNYNFYGTPTKFRMYGVDGQNPAFEFDGTNYYQLSTANTTDKPTHLACHKNYLFLSFPGGSVQNSNVGEPGNWSGLTGSSENLAGAEVTNLLAPKGDVLFISTQQRILGLTVLGELSTWSMAVISPSAGAIARTMQAIGDQVYLWNENGLTNISAVDAYGDFAAASFSRKVRDRIDPTLVSYAYASQKKGQYRVVLTNGQQYTVTFQNGGIQFTQQNYGVTGTCAAVEVSTAGEELIYFGDSTGLVYRGDYGNSFAGATISATCRLGFNPLGSPTYRKRFRKLTLEVQTQSEVAIQVAPEYDYGAYTAPPEDFDAEASGDVYGSGEYGEAIYASQLIPRVEQNIRGVGRDICVLFNHTSDDTPSFVINALTIQFEVWGNRR